MTEQETNNTKTFSVRMNYKNWSKSKKIVIAILLLPGILIAANALNILIFGLIILTDQAQYDSNGSNLGQIDYDKFLSSANKTGYTVVEADFGYMGVHPFNIVDLDEGLGKDYRFLWTEFFYRENVYFSAEKYDLSEDSTAISFYNEKSPYTGASLKLEDLPPDEWIVEKFSLMFGLTEPESRNYLTQLKDSISKNQEMFGSIIIKKTYNLQTVYSNLNKSSTSSNFTSTGVNGWVTETFYTQDKKIGSLKFVVPNARIIFRDRGHEYTINIDSAGGVALSIVLGVREEIPEEEYRRIFKEMFVNIGLQPEKVDEFKFNYVATKLNGN